jgi:hypothetical protein
MKKIAFRQRKDSRGAWKQRAALTHGANVQLVSDNKTLVAHNVALAKYASQCEKAMKACLATCAEALDGMLVILTPGQKQAKSALETTCRIIAPFAADLPKEELEALVPAKVMPYISGFLRSEVLDRPKEVIDALRGSEEDQGEVQTGGTGDDANRQDGSECCAP